TTLTLPLNTAGSSPGTWALLLTRPASGGSTVCGAGRPIRAEGMREGSPVPSRNQKIAASAAKASSGSAIGQDLIQDRRCGDVPVAVGSLIGPPPRCARSDAPRPTHRVRADALSAGDNRSRSSQSVSAPPSLRANRTL